MSKRRSDAEQTMAAPAAVSQERLAKVDAARQAWIRQLVDMSRRNNLLYFHDLKVGTLDLSDANPDVVQRLLRSGADGGETVRLSNLVEEPRRTKAAANLTEIARRARANFEERGLDTLFLAVGLATWNPSDGGRKTSAPVLLVPLEVKQAGGRSGVWSVRRNGDIKLNDVLVHALKEEYRVNLRPDDLLTGADDDDQREALDPTVVFSRVRQQAVQVPGFHIAERWIVGNFAFQKMAIVKDLTDLLEALAAHDLVAAIARDSDAEQAVRGDRASVDPGEIDRQPPDEEFLIRDADSSQQQAIAATLRGQNGVISGPPGTGKSQTISNLIAELVAQGKTVLFVAEKRAALDVVLNRLNEVDLGHLCLDCHGAELSRRRIAEQFQESLQRVREAPLPDVTEVHRKFVERRNRLNAHVRALHETRPPWGISLYQVYGRLLKLPEEAGSTCRLPADVVSAIDAEALEAACEQMRELASLAPLFLGKSSSGWTGASLTTSEEVRTSLECARRLARERWPNWERAFTTLTSDCPARPPRTFAQLGQLIDLLFEIDATLETCQPAIFVEDLSSLEAALQPARSWFGGVMALVFDGGYRSALRAVRRHCFGSGPPMRQALEIVQTAKRQLSGWRELATDTSSIPTRQPQLSEVRKAWQGLLPSPLATIDPLLLASDDPA